MTAPAEDARPAEPAEVEALPLPGRPEAYLAVERDLRERLGLGGP